jgi:hypothetical protein
VLAGWIGLAVTLHRRVIRSVNLAVTLETRVKTGAWCSGNFVDKCKLKDETVPALNECLT